MRRLVIMAAAAPLVLATMMLPPIHPATHQPIGPDALAPLFPEAIIMQEVSTEPWHSIPGPVMDIYRLWRPTPLYRATRLEQALQTPAPRLSVPCGSTLALPSASSQ